MSVLRWPIPECSPVTVTLWRAKGAGRNCNGLHAVDAARVAYASKDACLDGIAAAMRIAPADMVGNYVNPKWGATTFAAPHRQTDRTDLPPMPSRMCEAPNAAYCLPYFRVRSVDVARTDDEVIITARFDCRFTWRWGASDVAYRADSGNGPMGSAPERTDSDWLPYCPGYAKSNPDYAANGYPYRYSIEAESFEVQMHDPAAVIAAVFAAVFAAVSAAASGGE